MGKQEKSEGINYCIANITDENRHNSTNDISDTQ